MLSMRKYFLYAILWPKGIFYTVLFFVLFLGRLLLGGPGAAGGAGVGECECDQDRKSVV